MTNPILTPSDSLVPPHSARRDAHAHAPAPAPAPARARIPALAPEHPHAAYARLLSSRRVRAYLFTLLRGLPMQRPDKEDVVGDVLDALWKRRTDADPPATRPRMLGLARKILRERLANHWKHVAVVEKHTVDAPRVHRDDEPGAAEGPGDQPNYVEELRPPRSLTPERALQMKQKMSFVQQLAPKVGMTDDDVEVMWAMTYDHGAEPGQATWESLAAERGTSAEALRKRIERIRAALKKGWAKQMRIGLGPKLLLTLMLLLMLVFYVLAAVGPARQAPPPAPPPDPTPPPTAPIAPAATTTAAAVVPPPEPLRQTKPWGAPVRRARPGSGD